MQHGYVSRPHSQHAMWTSCVTYHHDLAWCSQEDQHKHRSLGRTRRECLNVRITNQATIFVYRQSCASTAMNAPTPIQLHRTTLSDGVWTAQPDGLSLNNARTGGGLVGEGERGDQDGMQVERQLQPTVKARGGFHGGVVDRAESQTLSSPQYLQTPLPSRPLRDLLETRYAATTAMLGWEQVHTREARVSVKFVALRTDGLDQPALLYCGR